MIKIDIKNILSCQIQGWHLKINNSLSCPYKRGVFSFLAAKMLTLFLGLKTERRHKYIPRLDRQAFQFVFF